MNFSRQNRILRSGIENLNLLMLSGGLGKVIEKFVGGLGRLVGELFKKCRESCLPVGRTI